MSIDSRYGQEQYDKDQNHVLAMERLHQVLRGTYSDNRVKIGTWKDTTALICTHCPDTCYYLVKGFDETIAQSFIEMHTHPLTASELGALTLDKSAVANMRVKLIFDALVPHLTSVAVYEDPSKQIANLTDLATKHADEVIDRLVANKVLRIVTLT